MSDGRSHDAQKTVPCDMDAIKVSTHPGKRARDTITIWMVEPRSQGSPIPLLQSAGQAQLKVTRHSKLELDVQKKVWGKLRHNSQKRWEKLRRNWAYYIFPDSIFPILNFSPPPLHREGRGGRARGGGVHVLGHARAMSARKQRSNSVWPQQPPQPLPRDCPFVPCGKMLQVPLALAVVVFQIIAGRMPYAFVPA